MGFTKDFLKREINKRAVADYYKKVSESTVTFDDWIRKKEANLKSFDMTLDAMGEDRVNNELSELSYAARVDDVSVRIVPYSKVQKNFLLRNYLEDIIVFANGELTERALPLIVEAFNKNPEVSVVYGDEDVARLDESESTKYGRSIYGTRENPFFKPDWSPNTFLDHFYFCNIVALRRASFRDIPFDREKEGAENIYDTLIKFIFESERSVYKSVYHIDEILIHVKNYELNRLKPANAMRHLSKVISQELQDKINAGDIKITVVIPSKDNPGLLESCLKSLYSSDLSGIALETIVVDNGSGDSAKRQITELKDTYNFRYEYMPMEFNFAYMCNYGASLATGDVFLFMNDDIEISDKNTLQEMLSQVLFKFTGACGLKLLYPDSVKIQHAGVVNTRIGPVHKLQFLDDTLEYYHGFNRHVNNVLSVTGAMLMVRADAYKKVQGMNEALKVAFNDMDLCYKLYESGYMNVVINSIHAYHKESVTRGRDTDVYSIKRLNDEKEKLFNMHPSFRFFDPFYSKYLNTDCLDVRISAGNEYEYERAVKKVNSKKAVDISTYREEPCVQLSVEYAGPLNKYIYEEKSDNKELYLQGFTYVSGSDNALYKKRMLLSTDKVSFAIDFDGTFRKDVLTNCDAEVNVAMSGFALKIPTGFLEPGDYRVGVIFEKKFSKEKLYIFSNKYLVVR